MRSSFQDLLNPHTSGLQSSKETPTIIFLCGFPDTSDSWSRLASHFESSHHVIKMAMPDYESDRLRRFWGYSTEEVVKALALVIEPHWKKQSQVILVGHDWGSFIGLLYLTAYPDTVHKFVTLDIGIRDTLDLVSVSYMTYLAFVFIMSRILPDQLALLLFALYPWKAIGPCPYETDVPSNAKELGINIKTDVTSNSNRIKAFMCYPYFQTIIPYFFSMICGMKFPLPKTPTLFLYGGKKRVMFHSPSYLSALEKDPDSSYKEYPDCGHWLHWTNADEVYSDISTFLNQKT